MSQLAPLSPYDPGTDPLDHAFDDQPLPQSAHSAVVSDQVGDLGRGIADMGAQLYDALSRPDARDALPTDVLNAEYGVPGYLRFNEEVTASEAAFQSQMAHEREYRDTVFARTRPQPLTDLGLSLGGSLIDPTNFALQLTTGGLGDAVLGAREAEAGWQGISTLGRVANLARGAPRLLASGAIDNLPFVGINAAVSNYTGDDYGAANALIDLASGAVLHTGLHLAVRAARGMLGLSGRADELPQPPAPGGQGLDVDPAPAAGVPALVNALSGPGRRGAWAMALDQASDDQPVDVARWVAREAPAPNLRGDLLGGASHAALEAAANPATALSPDSSVLLGSGAGDRLRNLNGDFAAVAAGADPPAPSARPPGPTADPEATRGAVADALNLDRPEPQPAAAPAADAKASAAPAPGPDGRPIRTLGLPADAAVITAGKGKPGFDAMTRHPDFKAAKAGDADAAVRLVRDVGASLVERARAAWGDGVTYLPVHAPGRNMIPTALAHMLAREVGGEVDHDVVQVSTASRRAMRATERLAMRAEFDGPIEPGRRYVLVDDGKTMGGTLAELADHVRRNGGEVAGVATLADKSKFSRATILDTQRSHLETRYGAEAIRKHLGVDIGALTSDEAAALKSAGGPPDTLGDGISAARGEYQRRTGAGRVGPGDGGEPAGGDAGPRRPADAAGGDAEQLSGGVAEPDALVRQVIAADPDLAALLQSTQRMRGVRLQAAQGVAADGRVFRTDAKPVGRKGLGAHLIDGLYGQPAGRALDDETDRAFDAVAQTMRRLAPQVHLRAFEFLRTDEEVPLGNAILGATYRRAGRVIIAWSLDTPDPVGTIRHEVIHALRESGLITDDEWNTLEIAAVEEGWLDRYNIFDRYPDLGADMQIEEAVAERFREWGRDGAAGAYEPDPSGIGALFDHLRTVVLAIGAALRRALGEGVTASDIFDRIDSGEVGARERPRPPRRGGAAAEAAAPRFQVAEPDPIEAAGAAITDDRLDKIAQAVRAAAICMAEEL